MDMSHLETDFPEELSKIYRSRRIERNQPIRDDEEDYSYQKLFYRILTLVLVVIFYSGIFTLGLRGYMNLGNLLPLARIAEAEISAVKQAREEIRAELFEKRFGNSIEILANDSRLVEMIRIRYLYARRRPRYRLRFQIRNSTTPISLFLRSILRNKTEGFFVEYRIFDGEIVDTLDLENNLNWDGLLIEPNPVQALRTLKLYRKTWLSDACVSTLPHPHKLDFSETHRSKSRTSLITNINNNVSSAKFKHRSNDPTIVTTIVQCVPFYSLLLAVNVTTIDYFRLDIEGSEYKILKLIPYDKIRIQVLDVRNWVKRSESQLIRFLETKGFVQLRKNFFIVNHHLVFIHQSLTVVPSNKF